MLWAIQFIIGANLLAGGVGFETTEDRMVAVNLVSAAHGELGEPLSARVVALAPKRAAPTDEYEFEDTNYVDPDDYCSISVPLTSPPRDIEAAIARTRDGESFKSVLLSWGSVDTYTIGIDVGLVRDDDDTHRWQRSRDPYFLRRSYGLLERLSHTPWPQEDRWTTRQQIAENAVSSLIDIQGASQDAYDEILHSVQYDRLLVAAARKTGDQFLQHLIAYISASNLIALAEQQKVPVYSLETFGPKRRVIFYPVFMPPSTDRDSDGADDLGRAQWYETDNSPLYVCRYRDEDNQFWVNVTVSAGPMHDHTNGWPDDDVARAALLEGYFAAASVLEQFESDSRVVNEAPSP